MKRASGVLLPVFSLPGKYSIGSLGKPAKDFIDFLKESGFSHWQILPLGMTDAVNSPYKSCSAFGGNPYYIDLEALLRQGLLTKEELEGQTQQTPYVCEYGRLAASRFHLLRQAAGRMADRAAVKAFIAENPQLANFCKFMCLKTQNGWRPWYEWTESAPDPEELFFWQFTQYEFFTMWAEIKAYANENGVKIIGDMPFYVDWDSCDVWANKKIFLLDEKNRPIKVAGVPPDYFSQEGQLWGNPLYNWDEMEKDGYAWWQARMRHMAAMLDGVRIDHFRGIESYYAVAGYAKTAKEGVWEPGPGLKLIQALKPICAGKQIIAEDLGEITPEVTALVEESGFPGMRVFQFAFLGDTDSPHRPHNYANNCVAYTGTHDNNTLLGYMWEQEEKTREEIFAYCGHSGDLDSSTKAILRTMLASHAGLTIFPLQDILGYGCDTRLNTPGTTKGNWLYRVTDKQLKSIDRFSLRQLNYLYAR